MAAGLAQQAVAAEVAADGQVLQLGWRQRQLWLPVAAVGTVDGVKVFLLRFVRVEELRRRQGRVGKGEIAAAFVDVADLRADSFFAELVADIGIERRKGAQISGEKERAFSGCNAEMQSFIWALRAGWASDSFLAAVVRLPVSATVMKLR